MPLTFPLEGYADVWDAVDAKQKQTKQRWFCTLHSNGLADTTAAPQFLFISSTEAFQKPMPDGFWTRLRSGNQTATTCPPCFRRK